MLKLIVSALALSLVPFTSFAAEPVQKAVSEIPAPKLGDSSTYNGQLDYCSQRFIDDWDIHATRACAARFVMSQNSVDSPTPERIPSSDGKPEKKVLKN